MRLLEELRRHGGVLDAHVKANDGESKLCVHYDPSALPVDEIEKAVVRAGAQIVERFGHLRSQVRGLRHERQAQLAEAAIKRSPGILRASVSFGTRQVYVEFDPSVATASSVRDAVTTAGLELAAEPGRPKARAGGAEGEHGNHEGHDSEGHVHGSGVLGEHGELIFSLACGGLTGLGWLLARLDTPRAASLTAFVAAYALGSWFTTREVAVAVRARRFEIDFLMLLAAAGAAVLGEWFEGALLLSLFTLGHSLEGFAMGRARKAIEGLADLVPATAELIDESGNTREVAADALAVGDKILVKPNSRIAADGLVIAGRSAVDQAPITGESVPVDKSPVDTSSLDVARAESVPVEHRVFAGTINGAGALTVLVSRPASDSTLARVVTMVSSAEAQRSDTQRFTARFERVFVPAILVMVAVLLCAPLVLDEEFSRSFYRAMAVLVAASPCALAIATSSAVLAGVARAARAGVLFKGGAHLEALGLVRAIAFDKTGTLTEGKPRLTDIRPAVGTTREELLLVTLAVERQSDHPLARAVTQGALAELGGVQIARDASDVKAIIGFGVQANVAGDQVRIGKPGLFAGDWVLPDDVEQASNDLQNAGRTVMIVQRGETFLGVLGVMDAPREGAATVVRLLRELGIQHTIMLTGDNQAVASAVAAQVGIQDARGDLLPEDKVAAIVELAANSQVAMVGDGVNDAPAMTSATVGIAMGASGSSVALETADVALMADDLHALPFAVALSRAAKRIIRQNMWASLGMVAFLIPATLVGVANMGVAVVLHEGSTLLVVFNALRLLGFRADKWR